MASVETASELLLHIKGITQLMNKDNVSSSLYLDSQSAIQMIKNYENSKRS